MAQKTRGYIIRWESDSKVWFATDKGPTENLSEARVWQRESAAGQKAALLSRVPGRSSVYMVPAKLDSDGRPAWVHPGWLKTTAEAEID